MNSVDRYVRRNGVDVLIEEISSIVDDDSEPHELPQRTNVDMDEWFDFLLDFEEATSRGPSHSTRSTLVMPQFNYISVEKEFTKYVRENQPVEYEEVVNHVFNKVQSVDSKEDISRWMEFSEIEFNQDDKIVSISPSSAEL
jgi:hypothetical protein